MTANALQTIVGVLAVILLGMPMASAEVATTPAPDRAVARRRHAPVDDRDDPMRIGNPRYQKVTRSARGTNRSAGNASDLAVKTGLDTAAGHHTFHDAAQMKGSTVGGRISAFKCCTYLDDSAQRHVRSKL
jgi:hypothetical protein